MSADKKNTKAQSGEKKEPGLLGLKIIVGLIAALVIAVSVLGHLSGADRQSRGTLVQGEKCTSSSECASGFTCYSYKESSFQCHRRCGKSKECPSGTTCKTVVKNARRKLKTADLCISNADI